MDHLHEPKKTKNRFHVDLGLSDWDADVQRVLALGATRIGDYDESGAVGDTGRS